MSHTSTIRKGNGRASAPAVHSGFDTDLVAAIERQRGRVRRGEWEALGALEKIYVEASGVADLSPGNSLVDNKLRCASLDWYKTGPLLSLSEDHREILICTPLVTPPDIPDPAWRPVLEYDAEGQPLPVDETKRPMIPQPIREVCSGTVPLGSSVWAVIQPIHQVLVIAANRKGWTTVEFTADAQGRHCALVLGPDGGEAHFVYGRPEVKSHFHS